MTSSSTDRRLGLTGGTAFKAPCLAATTANITLSAAQTIDSVAVVTGNRVLVKNQTTTTENGIYVADSGAWTRDLDSDGNNDWTQGTLLFVVSGSANGAGLFEQTTAAPITVGTTAMAFTKIATLAASAVTQVNVQNGQLVSCTVSGTNTILGTTVGTVPSALGTGQFIFFVPANTNTGATTFNRDSLGAVSIFYDGAALIGGELVQNIPALIFHDGTQYQLLASAWANTNYQTTGSVASAATLNLDTAKPYSQITGAVTVTAITLGNGRIRYVEFASTPLLTNGTSLILPSGANITAAAGDTAAFIGEASSVVRCLWYQRASGNTISGSTTTFQKYISGLTYANNATDSIDISAGCAVDSTNAALMTLASTLTKNVTATWAVGSVQGGLDTGAVGNSDYYIWLIQRTDTNVVDALFSLSSTAPTMPTNYSLKRLIGWFKRVGGSNVAFHTYEIEGGGLELAWDVPTLDINLANTLTTTRRTDAVKVPLNISTIAHLNVCIGDASALATAWIYCPDQTDAAPSVTAAPLATMRLNQAVSEVNVVANLHIRTSATGTIAARADLATVDLYAASTMGLTLGRRN